MRLSTQVPFALVFVAATAALCSESTPVPVPRVDPPPHVQGAQLLLVDSTAECLTAFPQMLKTFGANPYPRDAVPLEPDSISTDSRERLLEVASRWAISECYLPCAFEMCVCLLRDPAGQYGAYIAPCENDEFAHVPEAMIFVSPKSYEIEAPIRFHSPCRDNARIINWVRDSCK